MEDAGDALTGTAAKREVDDVAVEKFGGGMVPTRRGLG